MAEDLRIPALSPVQWTGASVRLLDQRLLPRAESYVDCSTAEEVASAIRDMVVRGAPAIGVAAAFGIALEAARSADLPASAFEERIEAACSRMASARPTAVNLRWAVERMRRLARDETLAGRSPAETAIRLEQEALRIRDEDLASCLAIGRHGRSLVPNEATVLTHCNAGALATAGHGTALGIVRTAVAEGKKIRVLASETRPFLQGARLTAWELLREGIETILVTDAATGSLLRSGEVDLVVVGADRIAANGDVANKIGTYPLAVLARENGVPFYVAAPLSSVDFDCPDGGRIPVEHRDPREVTEFGGVPIAPDGVRALNPAFDITPARYVTAIVTEKGIARPPYEESLSRLARRKNGDS